MLFFCEFNLGTLNLSVPGIEGQSRPLCSTLKKVKFEQLAALLPNYNVVTDKELLSKELDTEYVNTQDNHLEEY